MKSSLNEQKKKNGISNGKSNIIYNLWDFYFSFFFSHNNLLFIRICIFTGTIIDSIHINNNNDNTHYNYNIISISLQIFYVHVFAHAPRTFVSTIKLLINA